jgi:1-acyl-sn-glycerol-3-phosphate acyltransferase
MSNNGSRVMLKRKLIYGFVKILMSLLTRTEFLETEHLPAEGGVIIATNHMSRLDSPFLLLNPVRSDIIAMFGHSYREHPFFRLVGEMAGVIWIDRTKADFTAFRQAQEELKQGGALGIALEGTRSRNAQLLEGKQGIVLLATRVDVPIVPVAVTGSEDAMEKISHGKRPVIQARFGPPFRIPALGRENRDEQMKCFTDEIMCRIAALMPDHYHGFYAGHPRIQEIRDGKLDFPCG